MLPQLVLKFFTPKIIKAIMQYVFEKNELDVKCDELGIQYRDIEQKCTDIGFKVSAMQTVLKDLGDDSNSPVISQDEWKEVKETIKKIKNKRIFKGLNAK